MLGKAEALEKEFSEMEIIRKAEADGHITVQHTFDIKKIELQRGQDEFFEYNLTVEVQNLNM